MDPKKLFIDERFLGVCAYCCGRADTRDHVPSKALLDEPYPDNLPVAESCSECNRSFSADEEYLSCLIECVIQGTTKPNNSFRSKVAKTLRSRPVLAARIECGKSYDEAGNARWLPEWERVQSVILKLARGHISYDLGLQRVEETAVVEIIPAPLLTDDKIRRFNSSGVGEISIYPEIGSRAFIDLLQDKPTSYGGWHIVQQGRYRYAIGQSQGDWVKIVIREYLLCYVEWNK